MRVLLTGGAGYLGSVLARTLMEGGFRVKCLDRLFFGEEPIQSLLGDPQFELVREDIRWFDPALLRNIDIVMDLAALSNDPTGDLDPAKTFEINHWGRVRVAKLGKKYGVERYILASSCSVYGCQEKGPLDERSEINPLTTYASANAKAEEDTLSLTDQHFAVTALRLATVYGVSPRMRFDLAVNGMTVKLYQTGKIAVMRDGSQWRPFIHVKDTARAFLRVAKEEPEQVAGEIFNVGSDDQNYQILSLAREVGNTMGNPYELEWYGDPDKRSYIVRFSKLRESLGFKPKFMPRDGVKEVYNALARGEVEDTPKTRTVEWYKRLLESAELAEHVSLRGRIL